MHAKQRQKNNASNALKTIIILSLIASELKIILIYIMFETDVRTSNSATGARGVLITDKKI